jgi:hypothetical protein
MSMPRPIDLYMRGRPLWRQRKPVATQRALDYYERAIAVDPAYALAWSGIADARGASPISSGMSVGYRPGSVIRSPWAVVRGP